MLVVLASRLLLACSHPFLWLAEAFAEWTERSGRARSRCAAVRGRWHPFALAAQPLLVCLWLLARCSLWLAALPCRALNRAHQRLHAFHLRKP